ncbi:hypothetical protein BDZ89DRAFT_571610 [Hymenopellis radicata]|nr:hypothetical protein BDZ89DRAFT_571610 [Hymenopellis radicata]
MSLSGGNNSNEAQRSLSRATAEQAARSRSPEPTRRPSQDLLRPSMDSGRSTPNVFKRPSLDMLRSLEITIISTSYPILFHQQTSSVLYDLFYATLIHLTQARTSASSRATPTKS